MRRPRQGAGQDRVPILGCVLSERLTATLAPSDPNSSAIVRPMPRVDPDTNATLPANRSPIQATLRLDGSVGRIDRDGSPLGVFGEYACDEVVRNSGVVTVPGREPATPGSNRT